MTPLKAYVPNLVLGIWLGCLGLVSLTLFTPLEFTPLALGNAPRWGLWGLAFPACRMLCQRTGPLLGLWRLIPWLLWGPLLAWQTLCLVLMTPDSSNSWSRTIQPLLTVFAHQDEWRTTRVLFRRGWQVVAAQRIVPESFHPRYNRTVLLTPLLPGLQWATSLDGKELLDSSWQVVDIQDLQSRRRHPYSYDVLQLSGDSAVHQRLRPYLHQSRR